MPDLSDAAIRAKAVNLNAAGFLVDYLGFAEGQKKVAESHEFVLSPGDYPAIKGADRIMINSQLLDDLSGDQLRKLQSELRQVCIGE